MNRSLDVFVDSREKKPFTFSDYPRISTEERRLKTGDYCVAGDGETREEDSHFYPNYAVERKADSDFTKSITWERGRFEAELRRADDFAHRMPVVVEKPLLYYKMDKHYSDVNPNSIVGTVESHPNQFYMDYFFNKNRREAERVTKEFLLWRSRKL